MKELDEISKEEFLKGQKGASFVPLLPQEIHFPSTGGQILINFEDKNQCPTCKVYLVFKHPVIADWPYTHVDIKLECPECDATFLFGIPREPLFGMELIIWDSNPENVISQAARLEKPRCRFHKVEMKMTKIWGDKVMVDSENIRVQWKCPFSNNPDGTPTCFLTEHLTVPRQNPSETKVSSDKALRKRLDELEYLNILQEDTNYIVSGLERSGTSLMMQILNAGFTPIAYDDSRPADKHNPKGYYELGGGKIINKIMNGLFPWDQYKGKFVKVTAHGIQSFPEGKYKIVFMLRNLDEIMLSSEKMGASPIKKTDLQKFLDKTIILIDNRPDIEVIYVNHHSLFTDEVDAVLEKVKTFTEDVLEVDQAKKAIVEELYRSRV